MKSISTGLRGLAAAAAVALSAGAAWAGGIPFQPLVDGTPPGGTLEPAPGVYSGPVVIDKPISILGYRQVVIDNEGEGSLIVIETDGATVDGLVLVNSGDQHHSLDAGIKVRGDLNTIRDNLIEGCLFGIDLQQSNNNVVERNRITSKGLDTGVQGDAIRLWYSMENKVLENVITDARDFVVWYSENNRIAGNYVARGRYGLHFMYSRANVVEYNRFVDNSVGIYLMYSDGVIIRHNYVARSKGPSGLGIGFKEASQMRIEDNEILGNAVGLFLDLSPFQPDTVNTISGNRIAFNGSAIVLHSEWQGNVFDGNDFKGNFSQVIVPGGGTAKKHLWRNNYWDVYNGFDTDRDGRGDAPFELYAFSDRIWMDVIPAAYFRGSPILELIDFLERLAPFSDPKLLLRERHPRLRENPVDRALPMPK